MITLAVHAAPWGILMLILEPFQKPGLIQPCQSIRKIFMRKTSKRPLKWISQSTILRNTRCLHLWSPFMFIQSCPSSSCRFSLLPSAQQWTSRDSAAVYCLSLSSNKLMTRSAREHQPFFGKSLTVSSAVSVYISPGPLVHLQAHIDPPFYTFTVGSPTKPLCGGEWLKP